ncbi:MAG TPA: SH3 domain-containing protein [Terriglobales bacterium]
MVRLTALLLLVPMTFSAACRRGASGTGEYVYVSVPQANLRDRVAAVYNKVGTVKSGERLEVLDRQKRFLRVRTPRKEEGWLEQRFTITEDTFKSFEKLDQESRNLPVQGKAVTRATLNMHLEPSRDADTLYQLAEAEKIDVLKRATTERPPRPGAPVVSKTKGKAVAPQEPPKIYDDWWLVRSQSGHFGWALARMVDLDIPLDIAQYAEGQRIQGAYVLNEVEDGGKKVPQYLVVLSTPKDGMPFDYNQARVFTWSLKRHRYETAYRERNFVGFFPVKAGKETYDKEGELPTFTLRMQTEGGQIVDRKYKLNSTIVRRVSLPGDETVKLAKAEKTPERKKK